VYHGQPLHVLCDQLLFVHELLLPGTQCLLPACDKLLWSMDCWHLAPGKLHVPQPFPVVATVLLPSGQLCALGDGAQPAVALLCNGYRWVQMHAGALCFGECAVLLCLAARVCELPRWWPCALRNFPPLLSICQVAYTVSIEQNDSASRPSAVKHFLHHRRTRFFEAIKRNADAVKLGGARLSGHGSVLFCCFKDACRPTRLPCCSASAMACAPT